MFSQSNSYLGGSTGARPGGPPYSQSPFSQQQQPQNTFSAQQTGFGGGLQQQYTGYPPQQQHQQQQLQHQPTGFPGQNGNPQAPQPPQQLQQQQPFQSQPTGFVQNQPQPNAAPQQPQPTGMTSAQMANSFKGAPSQNVQQPTATTASSAIPRQRLSFVTATDQAKFEQLFKSAVGNDQSLSGDQARGLLIRSQLPGETLSNIWTLADTTKSGRLMFPEFALAMYLCNLALVGKTIPGSLPERIRNEVSSMVDIISFAIPDDQPQRPAPPSNAPNFGEQQPAAPPQPSNSQLLSSLAPPQIPQPAQPQPTGFGQQPTGYQQPLQPQQTSVSSQPTGYPSNPQATGYAGPRPPMPPMPSNYQQPMQTGMAPLNSQPTGRPGQWGLVNAPSSGLPNIEALQQQMMPQAGREAAFTTSGLRGNASVPWAVTKDEKKIYDNLFKSWDGFGKGHILGSQAIEIFGQSGLEKPDLERIWTLSDPNNRGRLDLDEFAVAMHLIYRKLNGYPVPNRLPPELIPPSTRNLNASLGTVKSLLSRDAEERKSSPGFLESQKTGVSYLKNHSFSGANTNGSFGRKDASMYKNDDGDTGYRSSARHRLRDGGRSPSPAQTPSPASETADDMSLEQLQKRIREKQVLLDAIDFQDETDLDQDEVLDRKDRKDADDLYRRIRRIQEDIDAHPNATFRSSDSGAERRTFKRQLQSHQDRLPDLASQVRRAERAIADAQLELFRLKDAKLHPSSAAPIVGTGPGGSVTESDRVKARAKAMMMQRSAALAGKPAPSNTDDSAAASRRFEEENSRVRTERENNDRMVKDIEEGVATYSRSVEDTLRDGQDSTQNHEKRRWEDALGVEDEIKDFIFDLHRSSRAARIRKEDRPRDRADRSSENTRSKPAEAQRVASPSPQTTTSMASKSDSGGSSYSSYKTAEERAAFIKQQAEQRMAERLAALGIRAPAKGGNAAQQKDESQQKDREERLRQAEAEDARLEQERQQRLAGEQVTPPAAANNKTGKKAPPAPPSRTARTDSSGHLRKQSDAEAKRAENEIASRALKDQQEAQEAEIKSMQNEQQRQEAELRQQREEADSRRRALEERVRQGKMQKEEEKQRKKAAKRESEETKAREERLAAQRAEIEAAKRQEAELQRQLEDLNDDDSSDDEGPQQITPTGSSQELPHESFSSGSKAPEQAPPSIPEIRSPQQEAVKSPPASSITSPSAADPASNNPFFKRMQSTDSTSSAQQQQATTTADNNPFHRFSASNQSRPSTSTTTQAQAQPLTSQSTGPNSDRRTRARAASEDDWSVVDSSSDDDGNESESESGGANRSGAKHLASILFGTMAPPRPMSSMGNDDNKGPDSAGLGSPPPPMSPAPMPESSAAAPAGPPPPPPPMPQSNSNDAPGTPGAPPPPPPMMPGSAPPPPPPMAPAMPSSSGGGAGVAGPPAVGALLGEIQMGKGLKKTQTKDRSASAVAGRVLG